MKKHFHGTMTLLLNTSSHGTVESGFFGCYTGMARLGEYAFLTQHVCNIGRALADNASIRSASLPSFPPDFYWEQQGLHFAQVMKDISQSFEEGTLLEYRVKPAMAEHLELLCQTTRVPLTVEPDESGVQMGIYRIPAWDFGYFVRYLARGGITGWSMADASQKPAYADLTLEAIRMSRRPLFSEIREKMLGNQTSVQ